MTIYLTPPPNFSPTIEAAGCFIEFNTKFLFVKRAPSSPEPNTWCLPGGKLEKGETPKMAIIREIEEEVALQLNHDNLIPFTTFYKRLSEDYIFHTFHISLKLKPKLQIQPKEHTDLAWLNLDHLRDLPLISGADVILNHFIQEKQHLITPSPSVS